MTEDKYEEWARAIEGELHTAEIVHPVVKQNTGARVRTWAVLAPDGQLLDWGYAENPLHMIHAEAVTIAGWMRHNEEKYGFVYQPTN